MNSLSKRFSLILKNIDIFGRKTELKINKHSKFKTTIGGCFTLVLIILCVFLFLSFGSDMFYHQNPSAFFSQRFTPVPARTFFSKDSYFFMFGVQNATDNHFIDESVYTVTIFNRRWFKNNGSADVQMEAIPCSEYLLPSKPELREYFLGAPGGAIESLYCIKDLDKYQLAGSYDVEEYSFIELTVNACQNGTNKTICKPFDVIESSLGYFALYQTDYLIDPQTFIEPGKPIGFDYFTPLSMGIQRYTTRYIADVTVNSNDGFLISDINYYKYPTYKVDKESLVIDAKNEGQVMYFVIRKDHNEIVYERSYKKLQNILAEIGGLFQVLYLAFLAQAFRNNTSKKSRIQFIILKMTMKILM